MVNVSVCISTSYFSIKNIILINYCCYLLIFKFTVLQKKQKKIVKDIIIFWLRWQTTDIYLHSWIDKLVLVVEWYTCQRSPVCWLKCGFKNMI